MKNVQSFNEFVNESVVNENIKYNNVILCNI